MYWLRISVCFFLFTLCIIIIKIDCAEQSKVPTEGNFELNEAEPISLPNTNRTAGLSKQALFKPNSYQLARRYGINSVLTSFLYSLSIVPFLFALKSIFTNRSYGFYGYRRKRSIFNGQPQLPFMNIEETKRFISLFETTLSHMKADRNKTCRDYYLCQVFKDALKQRSLPRLSEFEHALLNVFGAVTERYNYRFDPVLAVKRYYETATGSFSGVLCGKKYPCYATHQSNEASKLNST